jgi:hypothetical protein
MDARVCDACRRTDRTGPDADLSRWYIVLHQGEPAAHACSTPCLLLVAAGLDAQETVRRSERRAVREAFGVRES